MVRDEKMPAFVDHSTPFPGEVTVYYLPRTESNGKSIRYYLNRWGQQANTNLPIGEAGLASATAAYNYVRFECTLSLGPKSRKGVGVPKYSVRKLQENEAKYNKKGSKDAAGKGVLAPTAGDKTAQRYNELEPALISTRRELLEHFQEQVQRREQAATAPKNVEVKEVTIGKKTTTIDNKDIIARKKITTIDNKDTTIGKKTLLKEYKPTSDLKKKITKTTFPTVVEVKEVYNKPDAVFA